MTDNIQLSILGNKAIIDNINAFSKEMQARIHDILEEGGDMAMTHAKEIVPVDTGNLRDSISLAASETGEVTVGTYVTYAPYVELGHMSRAGNPVPARPFLMPAFEDASSWIQEQYLALGRELLG